MTKRRVPLRFAGLALATALTVLLAQHATSAAFTASTTDGGNQATAAASFCVSPGNNTASPLSPVADTAVYQANPTTNYGAGTSIGIGTAASANAYSYIKFTLPALPAHCDITAATLKIYASTPTAGGTLYVYRAAAAWNAATMTWNTGRVGFTGTPASTSSVAAAGWQQWDVTTLTQQQYAGTNDGYLLKDSVDDAASARYQTWASVENATTTQRPQLLLTWG